MHIKISTLDENVWLIGQSAWTVSKRRAQLVKAKVQVKQIHNNIKLIIILNEPYY